MRVVLIALMLASALVPLTSAAPDGFILLGEDPAQDAVVPGAGTSQPDTLFDILDMSVKTEGTDLVFFLGLRGDTTEIGTMCPMAAFQFDGTEYVGLDCFECGAYQCTNAASDARAASTSRGTNVASSVSLGGGGATIVIPIDAIGASLGDTIEDIYGLTYETRALMVSDVIPDAKSDRDAAESLGSYTLGQTALGAAEEAIEEAIEAVNETLEGEEVTVDLLFEEPTNAVYTYTWPANLTTVAATFGANFTEGNLTFTVLDGSGTELYVADFLGNITFDEAFEGAAGNWTFVYTFDGFVGSAFGTFGAVAAVEEAEVEEVDAETDAETSAEESEAPVDEAPAQEATTPGFALIGAIGVLAAIAVARRR